MIGIKLIADEIEKALELMDKHRRGSAIMESDWEQFFSTKGYMWLKEREKSMGRCFEDEEFKSFLLSQEMLNKYEEYSKAVESIKGIDVGVLAAKALSYLPAGARIETCIVPLIKEKTNSFVYSVDGKLCVFLYVNTAATKEKLENTITHELHHIGFDSIMNLDRYKELKPEVRKAVEWTYAFGEGFAMIAAAGGAKVHPNGHDKELKDIWDESMKGFNEDMKRLENFFLSVISCRTPLDKADENAFEFFGLQGPWYTVGWKMAAVVELIKGKEKLIECMTDPRKFLKSYNECVDSYNNTYGEGLEKWSQAFLDSLY
ncbi:MAG: DUF5700 domain-containing putative Zn-dependent protease [Bacillota bacterium]